MPQVFINPSRRKRSRRFLILMTGVALSTAVLSGCSGGVAAGRAEPTETPAPVSLEELTTATLSLSNLGEASAGCMSDALLAADLSPELQHLVVTTGEQDWGGVVREARDTLGTPDASVLVKAQFRGALDICERDSLGVTAGAPTHAVPVENIAPNAPVVVAAPNLAPSFSFHPNEEITMTRQLQPGLVTMLSSLVTPEEAAQINAGGECLSGYVLRSGLSQASLRFLAEGAPLGSGTVVEHLSTDEDKALWGSTTFSDSLSKCLAPAAA